MEALHLVHHIHYIREQKVILDADLAVIYGVSTKQLNQAVKRNANRFPEDFRFQLTETEWNELKAQLATSGEVADEDLGSQTVTSSEQETVAEELMTDLRSVSWGGRRTAPYAFTEHGAVMLSSVLRSERAVNASIEVVRTFIRMRTNLLAQEKIAQRILQLEANVDGNFQIVFEAINELMAAKRDNDQPRRMIGFKREEE